MLAGWVRVTDICLLIYVFHPVPVDAPASDWLQQFWLCALKSRCVSPRNTAILFLLNYMHCTAEGFRANYITSSSLREMFPLDCLQECCNEILEASLEYSNKCICSVSHFIQSLQDHLNAGNIAVTVVKKNNNNNQSALKKLDLMVGTCGQESKP